MTQIVRVISDGTPIGSKVLLDNGDRLEGITNVQWSLAADGTAEIRLAVFGMIPVELTGTVIETKVDTIEKEDESFEDVFYGLEAQRAAHNDGWYGIAKYMWRYKHIRAIDKDVEVRLLRAQLRVAVEGLNYFKQIQTAKVKAEKILAQMGM